MPLQLSSSAVLKESVTDRTRYPWLQNAAGGNRDLRAVSSPRFDAFLHRVSRRRTPFNTSQGKQQTRFRLLRTLFIKCAHRSSSSHSPDGHPSKWHSNTLIALHRLLSESARNEAHTRSPSVLSLLRNLHQVTGLPDRYATSFVSVIMCGSL
ncbi:hypothetical protein VTI74DRAFT_11142 [Chaetomium olivicolor]